MRIWYRAGDMWAPHLAAEEALKTETEHFIECIQKESQPISDGLSGLQVLRILEASSRSIAAQGTPVKLARARVPAKVAIWQADATA